MENEKEEEGRNEDFSDENSKLSFGLCYSSPAVEWNKKKKKLQCACEKFDLNSSCSCKLDKSRRARPAGARAARRVAAGVALIGSFWNRDDRALILPPFHLHPPGLLFASFYLRDLGSTYLPPSFETLL